MGGAVTSSGFEFHATMAIGNYNLSSTEMAVLTHSIGLTHCALGTGGGAPGAESATSTSLEHEVCRKHFYRRAYFQDTTSGNGDYVVNGTDYVISNTATPTAALFFRFEGAEGSFSGIDEIGIFGDCNYVSSEVTSIASGDVGDDICNAYGSYFNDEDNAVYTLTITQGGTPGTDSGDAQYSVTGSLGDYTTDGVITAWDIDCPVGTYGVYARFTQTGDGDGDLTLDNSWHLYCKANKAGSYYAKKGVWSTANPSGEVSDSGTLYNIEYITDFDKSGSEDYQYIYVVYFHA